MSPWVRLAWKEFWLPFHYRKSGCPGGRDLVWLTIFMNLLLTLFLLLLASREGLLNRFVDVLLGNVPGYGVPIAVTNNMVSKGGVNAIDTAVLAEMAHLKERLPGMSIHPYRTLEANLYPLVSLPDEHIWNNKRKDGSRFGPDFDGWAVYSEDPLWQSTAGEEVFPLRVVMSRTLFEQYFDYRAYRQTLQQHLPEEFWKALPEQLASDAALEDIWLQLTIGFRKELFRFQITWVSHFPVIDKIAYVFPLTTYYALKAAHDFPELRYFPENFGRSGNRVKQLLVEIDQQQPPIAKERVEAFASSLSGVPRDFRGDIVIALKDPLPQVWIEAFARQFTLTFESMETIVGDALTYQTHTVGIPCGRVATEVLRDLHVGACADDVRQIVTMDMTAKGNGFHHALIYVPDRTFLSAATEALQQVGNRALLIHPSYQDALNRFGFLSQMLRVLEQPYSVFLACLLLAFLGIQMATLIGHHRHRYGVFLAKGVEWWQIYAMLWLQIGLAMFAGMVGAGIIMTGISLFLQRAVKMVSVMYRNTLSLADLNLLPLTAADFLAVAGMVLTIALVLATILLYCLPLRRQTHPAMLL